MIDTGMNFFVWTRGLKGGPCPALHLLDPRSMMDWKEREPNTLAIYALQDHERRLTLTEAIVAYPCPAR